MKAKTILLAGALLLFLATAGNAAAQTPQYIQLDGINDFDPGNLLDADGGDTETRNWCGPDPDVESPMDIGDIFVTNDSQNLYLGFDYDNECFQVPAINIMVAIAVGDPATGGLSDPFYRKWHWVNSPQKPDFVFYVVGNGANYEIAYGGYDGAGPANGWYDVTASFNGTGGGAGNALGVINAPGFWEMALPLAALGVTTDDVISIEIIMTQDGNTKGPLDAAANDPRQLSTPAGTVFDLVTPVALDAPLLAYTVQDGSGVVLPDVTPPTVVGFTADPYNGTLELEFSEAMDPAGFMDPSRFVVLEGFFAFTPIVRGELPVQTLTQPAPDRVVLGFLPGALAPTDVFYSLRRFVADPPRDLAGNALAYDNEVAFSVNRLDIRLDAASALQGQGESFGDFTIVGTDPAFVQDGACGTLMALERPDPPIFRRVVDVVVPVDPVSLSGEKDLVFSFAHDCVPEADPAKALRNFHLSLNDPASQIIKLAFDSVDLGRAIILGAYFWSGDGPLVIEVDEDIDPALLAAATFGIRDEKGVMIPADFVTVTGKRLTVHLPAAPAKGVDKGGFFPGRHLELVVGEITDLAGNVRPASATPLVVYDVAFRHQGPPPPGGGVALLIDGEPLYSGEPGLGQMQWSATNGYYETKPRLSIFYQGAPDQYPPVGVQNTRTIHWGFVGESRYLREFDLTVPGPNPEAVWGSFDDRTEGDISTTPIEVVFSIDMTTHPDPIGFNTEVAIQLPDCESCPQVPPYGYLSDDGLNSGDLVAGDGIYTGTAYFQPGTALQDMAYLYARDAVRECGIENPRRFRLGDPNGRIEDLGGYFRQTLPTAEWDRCDVTTRDIEAVFFLDLGDDWAGSWTDVRITSPIPPLGVDPATSLQLQDDGVAPDLVADDGIYAAAAVFLAGSSVRVPYSFWSGGNPENPGAPARFVDLDNFYDAVGNPQLIDPDYWVPAISGVPSAARPAALVNAYPNPFNPSTTIVFDLPRRAEAVLDIFDVRGRRVMTLTGGEMEAGRHAWIWEGRDQAGRAMASGVYMARLRAGTATDMLKLMLLK